MKHILYFRWVMKKYKVCVYAISKNEEKNVKLWFESMKEADNIYVLDTGSTDNTVNLLKEFGVNVKVEVISPWRFDVARNKSLDMIPKDADICVCTDLDERFEKGWRNKLESIWNNKVNRVSYNYNWSFDEYGKTATSFYINKIHSRNDYIWENAVHEVLKNINNNECQIISNDIVLNHYQDYSKNRSSYLKLLELSVKENPNNDRNVHYLGREYMYYKKWNKCIDTLIKHLNLNTSTWKDERCASMRYIARSYIMLNRYNEAEMWLKNSVKEAPYLREPYFELGYLYYLLNNHFLAKKYLLKCLKIKDKSKSYLNEFYCWDGTIEDLLSICEFNLGYYKESLKYAKKAYKKKPNDERIKNNIKIIKTFL